jgi:hypothetical protein
VGRLIQRQYEYVTDNNPNLSMIRMIAAGGTGEVFEISDRHTDKVP